MDVKMIDVSEHNGRIDWAKVKAAGYHAIIRLGYGQDTTTQDDKTFKYNVSECERLGIPYGVYIYSYAKNVTQAKGEAAHALRQVKGLNLSYPIFYDVEEAGLESVAKENAIVFCTTILNAGYKAGIYANEYWWKSYLVGVEAYTKWVAKWSSTKPNISNVGIWQYSSTGTVAGINGLVDMNHCYIGATATGSEPKPTQTNIDQMVKDVYLGKYGNGEARKKSLGQNYQQVQNRLNAVDKKADDVIKGKYGNGEARKKALGADYDLVQWIVNQKLKK